MIRVHHLNGLTMCPWFGRHLLNERGCMVCHCLLLETPRGLILVDTALGTDDVRNPSRRIGRGFTWMTRPRLSLDDTIVAQIERRGFSRADVRHVVLTHLDLDHAGGIADFPEAAVHCSTVEHDAATRPRTLVERERYKPAQWAHGPRLVLHPSGSGERWNGFEAVRCVDDEPDVLLVPLSGHTRGHCGVAVRTGDGWLLHAGDAYFHRAEMAPEPACPFALDRFQRILAVDGEARVHNQGRLRDLVKSGAAMVFSAHDPDELARFSDR